MTDLSEQLRSLADQYGEGAPRVTFADVTAARARQRRTAALLTGALLAMAVTGAVVVLRPAPHIALTAHPAPSASPSLSGNTLPAILVATTDVPVPQRVLDGLAAITTPDLSHGPRGAVAWLRTDAKTAASFWPRSVRPGYAIASDPAQPVFVVAVSVANWVCGQMGSCVRGDGFMVGIVPDEAGAAITPMAVLDVPRAFSGSPGLRRFTAAGFPTGIAEDIAPMVLTNNPARGSQSWVQWQQKTGGQTTVHFYGHYVCGWCSVPRGARLPEGDLLTLIRNADGTGEEDAGGKATDDPSIEPGFTAVFLPPITVSPPNGGTSASPSLVQSPIVVQDFGLFTHCGPLSLVYEGRYFSRVGGRLTTNDPTWNFNTTYGTLTVSGDTAVFTDSAGHHETFEATTRPTGAGCD